jgi:hypothetical protein
MSLTSSALELDQCKEFQHISSFPWKKFSNAGAMARRYQICLTVRNLLRVPVFPSFDGVQRRAIDKPTNSLLSSDGRALAF